MTGARERRGLRIALRGGILAAVLIVLSTLVFKDGKVVRAVKDEVGMRNVVSYAADIRFAASESGVDPNLIAGVMYAESSGLPQSVSSAGALGLMQLSLAAAHDAARKLDLPTPSREDLLEDPSLNIRLGARHIAWLLKHEGSDLERVLVAYNAGRTKLRRWLDAAGGWDAWRAERMAAGNSDVLAYAHKVLAARDEFERRGAIVPGGPARTPTD